MARDKEETLDWLAEVLARDAKLIWPAAEFESTQEKPPYLKVEGSGHELLDNHNLEKETIVSDSGEVETVYQLSDSHQRWIKDYYSRMHSVVGEHCADRIFDPSDIEDFIRRYDAKLFHDQEGNVYCGFPNDYEHQDVINSIANGDYGRSFEDSRIIESRKDETGCYFRFYTETWEACKRHHSKWQDRLKPLPQQAISQEFVKARALRELIEEHKKEGAFLAAMHTFLAPENEEQVRELRTEESDQAFFYLPETDKNRRKIETLQSQWTDRHKKAAIFSTCLEGVHDGQTIYRFKVRKEYFQTLQKCFPEAAQALTQREVLQAPEFFDPKLPADTAISLCDMEDGTTILMLRSPHTNGGSTTVEKNLRAAGLVRDDFPRPNIEMATDQTHHGGVVASVLVPTAMGDAIRRSNSEHIQEYGQSMAPETLADAQQWAMEHLLPPAKRASGSRQQSENEKKTERTKSGAAEPVEQVKRPLLDYLAMLPADAVSFEKQHRLDGAYQYRIRINIGAAEEIGGMRRQDWFDAISGKDSAREIAQPSLGGHVANIYPIGDADLYYAIKEQAEKALKKESPDAEPSEEVIPTRFLDKMLRFQVTVSGRKDARGNDRKPEKRWAHLNRILFAPAHDGAVSIYFVANHPKWFDEAQNKIFYSHMQAIKSEIDPLQVTEEVFRPSISRITVPQDVAEELWQGLHEAEAENLRAGLAEDGIEELAEEPAAADAMDKRVIDYIAPTVPETKEKPGADKKGSEPKPATAPRDKQADLRAEEERLIGEFREWVSLADSDDPKRVVYWAVGFKVKQRSVMVPKTQKEIGDDWVRYKKMPENTDKQRAKKEKRKADLESEDGKLKKGREDYVKPVLYFATPEINPKGTCLGKGYQLLGKEHKLFDQGGTVKLTKSNYSVLSVELSPSMLASLSESYPHAVRELGQATSIESYSAAEDTDEALIKSVSQPDENGRVIQLLKEFKTLFKRDCDVVKEERPAEELAYEALARSNLMIANVQLPHDSELARQAERRTEVQKMCGDLNAPSHTLEKLGKHYDEELETGRLAASANTDAARGLSTVIRHVSAMLRELQQGAKNNWRLAKDGAKKIKEIPEKERLVPALLIVDPPHNIEEVLEPIKSDLKIDLMKSYELEGKHGKKVFVIYPTKRMLDKLYDAVQKKVEDNIDNKIHSAQPEAKRKLQANRPLLIKQAIAEDLRPLTLPDEVAEECKIPSPQSSIHYHKLPDVLDKYYRHEKQMKQEKAEAAQENQKREREANKAVKGIQTLPKNLSRNSYLAVIRSDLDTQEKPGREGLKGAKRHHVAAEQIGQQYALIVKLDSSIKNNIERLQAELEEKRFAVAPKYYDGLLGDDEVRSHFSNEAKRYEKTQELHKEIEGYRFSLLGLRDAADRSIGEPDNEALLSRFQEREHKHAQGLFDAVDQVLCKMRDDHGLNMDWRREELSKIRSVLSVPLDPKQAAKLDILPRQQAYEKALDTLEMARAFLDKQAMKMTEWREERISTLRSDLDALQDQRSAGSPQPKHEKQVREQLKAEVAIQDQIEGLEKLYQPNTSDGFADKDTSVLPAMTRTKQMDSAVVRVDKNGRMQPWEAAKSEQRVDRIKGDRGDYVALFLSEEAYELLKQKNGLAQLPKKNERKDLSTEEKSGFAKKNPADHPEEPHLLSEWVTAIDTVRKAEVGRRSA